MQIATVLSHLESIAPLSYQESYDNAGLLTGQPDWECKGILTTLDTTEAVVSEAAANGCNLIVSHHPLIFSGLKKITGANYVEKAVISAIRQDMAIYAIHTNLDHVPGGVNGRMAECLGLVNTRPLLPLERVLRKLICFVPTANLEQVRQAIFAAGAGHIGHYSECSWAVEGRGTFLGGADTRPFVGKPGLRHEEPEMRLEVILPAWQSGRILRAMIAAHPYEEVAYDLVDLANPHPSVGAGLVGELPEALDERAFLDRLKTVFRTPVIRHTPLSGRPVKTCALCGGAGSSLISNALRANVDFYITADVKYHEFFDANGRMLIADIGHYESEQFTVDLLTEILEQKFPNFAVLKSAIATNPVNYY
ncbi:MAG: Nif3-like dinuclear metal center hexameric protein [Bacteroidota bacterium]|nr:Nif3-like dinuclear metal center hexameric protein [Bacteroidota bacterium]